ncbi:MAG: isocitrate/isopropylmalate family dehydrogenase [Eubacteriales bacterium]|nr:isocitrate/isopropylmalate family dehydrogenase [Eubacteriales bacterium]
MHNITLIPGDGIGPEISTATQKILAAAGVAIQWDVVNAGEKVYEETGALIPDSVYESIERNKIVLKGPITTPIGSGFRSLNVALRKKYELYANVRPALSIGDIETRFDDIDITIFRENTEDLYAGIEEKISDDEMHSIKVITRGASARIARAAFEYAVKTKKSSVTVVTKANIMKLTDGLFLDVAREVARDYPQIRLDEVLVDNMCMQLVINPDRYEIILTENLYGDILSDLCAGLIGGLGLIPGANLGEDIAIFEAVHGSAPDIAGKNLANPTALTLSACLMLDHIGEGDAAGRIRKALDKTLSDKENFTADLGGNKSTAEFTEAVISNL